MPLVLAGEITSKRVGELLEADDWATGIVLNSPGGEVYSAFAIIDALRREPTTVVGYGLVASAALPIITHGAAGRRRAARLTTFMAHTGSIALEGDQRDMQAETREAARLDTIYWKLLAKTTKLSFREWKKLTRDGPMYFDAKDAKMMGVIDEII